MGEFIWQIENKEEKKRENIMCRSEQKQERNIPHGQKQR